MKTDIETYSYMPGCDGCTAPKRREEREQMSLEQALSEEQMNEEQEKQEQELLDAQDGTGRFTVQVGIGCSGSAAMQGMQPTQQADGWKMPQEGAVEESVRIIEERSGTPFQPRTSPLMIVRPRTWSLEGESEQLEMRIVEEGPCWRPKHQGFLSKWCWPLLNSRNSESVGASEPPWAPEPK